MQNSTYFKTRRTSLIYCFLWQNPLVKLLLNLWLELRYFFRNDFFDLFVPISRFKGVSLFHLPKLDLLFSFENEIRQKVFASDCPFICDSVFKENIHKLFGKIYAIFQGNGWQKAIYNTILWKSMKPRKN